MRIDFYMPLWENKEGEHELEQLIDLQFISKEDYDGIVPRPCWSDGNEVPEKDKDWIHVFTWKSKGNISYGLDQKLSNEMSAQLQKKLRHSAAAQQPKRSELFIRGPRQIKSHIVC